MTDHDPASRRTRRTPSRLLAGAFTGVLVLWVALLLGVIRGLDTAPAAGPAPSATSASLLFCSDRATDGRARQLFRMSLDGMDKHRVVADPVCVAWEVAPGTLLAVRGSPGGEGIGRLVRYRQDPANRLAEWRADTVFSRFTRVMGWPGSSPARRGAVVFVARDEAGQWDVWLAREAGDSIVRLTDDPAVERNPAWDPRDPEGPVVYTRYNASTGDEAAMRAHGGDLWAVDPRGGAPRRLTAHPLMDDLAQVRGDSVLFVRGLGVGAEDGDMELMLLRISDGVEERLTDNGWNDLMPAWSPDGRQICWQSEESGHYEMNIRVMRLDDRRERVLVDDPGRQANCLWSPDGRSVLYHERGDGDWDAFQVPLDGGEALNLTRFTGADDQLLPTSLTASPLETVSSRE